MSAAAEMASDALELVGRDPQRALALSDTALAVALDARDPAAAAVAQRAAGLALRELGDLVAAEASCRAAVRSAARGGAAQVEAEARMSLAFALLERGRVKAALTEADRAAAALRGLPAVRLATQRALILQRTGQLGQALAAYAAALPALRRFGDDLWEARLLNNRGLLHADQGTLTAAEADLHRARDLHTARGSEMLAAEAEWNLGVVAARRGDAPTALARFDRAGARHRRQGTPNPQLLLDRCHVLLGVGLVAEARQTADRAVRDLRDTGQGADLAEAQLLLARATLADGAAGEARTVAAAAQAAFTRQGRPGWSLLARSIRLRAAEAGGARPRRLLPAALECAAHLAAAGWRIAELDARLVAARAALGDGDLDTARDQLTLAAAGRRAGSLELRLRAWYALALLRNAGGDARGTQAALRAGLAVLDRQRAALGATELRVHLTAHGAELAGTGLGLALAAGNARGVLTWAERWRAGALRLHPARPPADSELAAALVEARRLADAFLHARLEGAAPPTSAALRAAEQRVVSASRTTRSVLHQPSAPPPTAAELAAELRGAVLVEYVTHDGQLLAVTVGARRTRLHRLGPLVAVTGRIEAAQFALVRLVRGFGTDRALAMVRIAALAAAARLDELLLAPLRREIGDRPLVIVPTGGLHSMPWGLLPSLVRTPVRVAPSAAGWLRAARSPPPDPAGRTVLAAGPRLPAAHTEVAGLAARYADAQVLLGPDATAEAVLAAIDGAQQAHLAAHGVLRTDNPLFSALELADGPLTVYDLERLVAAPRLMLLPACQSGITAVRTGDELIGLVSALLALDTRSVIATVIPVPDVPTAALMHAVHERLRAGDEPAVALAAARAGTDPEDPAGQAAACGVTCFGA